MGTGTTPGLLRRVRWGNVGRLAVAIAALALIAAALAGGHPQRVEGPLPREPGREAARLRPEANARGRSRTPRAPRGAADRRRPTDQRRHERRRTHGGVLGDGEKDGQRGRVSGGVPRGGGGAPTPEALLAPPLERGQNEAQPVAGEFTPDPGP